MPAAEKPPNEEERLAEVLSLDLLHRQPEERFDRITRLALRLFNVTSAVVTIVGDDTNWLLSVQGYPQREASRDESFCAHTILGNEVVQVFDATKDPRFFDNPYVVGEPNIRFYASCPISGPRGSNLGSICVFDEQPRELSSEDAASLRDLATMVEQEIRALQLATTDDLTGLSNRRGFDFSAPMLLDVCSRRGVQATLLFFDLDDFKAINDDFGHQEGDRALVDFATTLNSSFRTSDIIARYGGDEFVVILADASDPTLAIERVRMDLTALSRQSGRAYELSTSVGTATFDAERGEGLDELVARADAQMYRDKLGHRQASG
jgi:diguanylate cyclase (GGDEF)-like protein